MVYRCRKIPSFPSHDITKNTAIGYHLQFRLVHWLNNRLVAINPWRLSEEMGKKCRLKKRRKDPKNSASQSVDTPGWDTGKPVTRRERDSRVCLITMVACYTGLSRIRDARGHANARWKQVRPRKGHRPLGQSLPVAEEYIPSDPANCTWDRRGRLCSGNVETR